MRQRPSILVATLFGVLFLASLDSQVLLPLLPRLGEDLNVSIETLGWLFSAYALVAALFNLLLGPLTDRFGRVPFLRLGLLLFALVAGGIYLSRGYVQLFALRAAAGLAGGLLSTCTASLIGDLVPYGRRGRVMGIVLSAYFAAPVGVLLCAWVAQNWGWRFVFLGTSLLATLLLVRSAFAFPSDVVAGPKKPLTQVLHVYPEFFKRKECLGGIATSFTVSGGFLAFLTFLSGYLNGAFGLTPLQISWLFPVSGVAGMVGGPLSGWLSDRLTKRGVFLATNTILIFPLLAITRLPWGFLLVLTFFLVALAVAARQTALQTLQTQLVPPLERGAYLALRNGFSQLGISLSVYIAGNLYSKLGYSAVAIFSALLTLAGSIIFFGLIKEPREQGGED